MISKSRIEYMAERRMGIRHIKTGNEYALIDKAKGKIGDEWVRGVTYMSSQDYEMYWRSVDNFDGFEELG